MFDSISIVIFGVLFIVGYLAGTINEKRHYKSIKKREEKLLSLPAISMKRLESSDGITKSELVSESVVVSIDYFKRALAILKVLIGGSVGPYESLIDRARREAVLRMKESAPGAAIIINVRVETSTIGNAANSKGAVGSVEALAYGTAVWK